MQIKGLVIVFAVAACKANQGKACEEVGAAMEAAARAKLAPDMAPELKAEREKLIPYDRARIIKHCSEDDWSAQLIACSKQTKNWSRECNKLLTDEQFEKLRISIEGKSLGSAGWQIDTHAEGTTTTHVVPGSAAPATP